MKSLDLFAALEAHDLDRLASLLSAKADPNARKPVPPGWAPLHEAIEQLESGGPLEALVLLLRYGASVEAGGGDTPLLMALYRSQPQAVDLLLAHGADANVRGPEGDSPLRVAVERGDGATAATLLRCGAVRTIDEVGGPVGASALGIAARRLDLPLLELLLRGGADPAARDADQLTARERLPARTRENQERLGRAEELLGRR
ncbi:MAG TPA: ankyrin repeat domain-containing protein [Polyangiaceae bacterium]|jgi:ankyrin repeat protein